MDVIIPDDWLRDFLDTKADAKTIAKYVSLCGPSVERTEKSKNGYIYKIEVTTNRVDAAGVYGFAREAAAILPRFGIPATLKTPKFSIYTFSNKVNYLDVNIDNNLCLRFCAILIRNLKIHESPLIIQKRLIDVGLRPINNVVDISNYIMHEYAQPVHTFDYDKIKNSKMILRESRTGEQLTTLDGKNHQLLGGDIVIEDGGKRLIDLAGIMGGLNSAVDKNTKNVLLFVQTYNPVNIRKTSMRLSQHSEASSLFEKGLDTELVKTGILRGIDLFKNITNGKPEKEIIDLYPYRYKVKKVKVEKFFIDKYLGISVEKKDIDNILKSLSFNVHWIGNILCVNVPSFRANDIDIKEDIVEEIARIYGYHKLPSKLMHGALPDKTNKFTFSFEYKLKNILKGLGATETYTLSLVSKDYIEKNALRLKNSLGSDTEYLRNSLLPSLSQSAKTNSSEKESFHLFEMSNVYLPKSNNLPEERLMLAGILSNYTYRIAKGIIEIFLNELNIDYDISIDEKIFFKPSRRISIYCNKDYLGMFGVLEDNNIYYEFEINKLYKYHKAYKQYKKIPKYPPQIEDITFVFPARTKIGDVLQFIKLTDKRISDIELTDIYKNSYTFKIFYQDPNKTLKDEDVKKIRTGIVKIINKKYSGQFQE